MSKRSASTPEEFELLAMHDEAGPRRPSRPLVWALAQRAVPRARRIDEDAIKEHRVWRYIGSCAHEFELGEVAAITCCNDERDARLAACPPQRPLLARGAHVVRHEYSTGERRWRTTGWALRPLAAAAASG